MTPTIEQVLKHYRIIAAAERMKTGRPGITTVQNCIRGMRLVCAAGGIALSAPVTALTRATFDRALATFMTRGLARITAWSYVGGVRGVFARWCHPYYQDAGWEIPALDLPVFRAKAPRYVRPSSEVLARVKAWYGGLHGGLWFAATMMLEFAMRNGDVLRLKDENFIVKGCVQGNGARGARALPGGGGMSDDAQGNGARGARALPGGGSSDGGGLGVQRFLCYTPHKTELSSGRRVCWPVHPAIWSRIEDEGGVVGFDVTEETFAALNRELRGLGLTGSKGAYELRKICIDHIYQKFGTEMAVSLSGDDIKTISRYYADPSQPNLGTIRVIDLL